MEKCREVFLYSVIGILVVTGMAKLYSVAAGREVFETRTWLSQAHLLLLAGTLEIVIAIYLIWGRNVLLKLLAVAWLAGIFASYRIGSWWMETGRACGCVGELQVLLPVSEQGLNYAMIGILTFMWFGSCSLLLFKWLTSRVVKVP
jgi:hypothetical protein